MTEKQELEILKAIELTDHQIDYTKLKTETLEEIANYSRHSVKNKEQVEMGKLSKEAIDDIKLNMTKKRMN